MNLFTRTHTGLAVFILAAALLGTGTAGASADAPRSSTPVFVLEKGRFTVFDVPDRGIGEGVSVDNRGRIVGGTRPDDPASCAFRGYLRDAHGRFSVIAVPGAAMTNPLKINDHGQVVGNYRDHDPCTDPLNGFLRDERGRYASIRFPGSTDTQAAGINDRGQVVGQYAVPDGSTHGYVWTHGRYRTLDVAGAATTSLLDINDRGEIVGAYADPDGTSHGFVRDTRGRITTIDAAGAVYTLPFGINNRGQVVGLSTDALPLPDAHETHGFLLRHGAGGPFTRIDVPGAAATGAFDINDSGTIVGQYGNPENAARTPEEIR